jgi:hypothetical protein
MEDVGVTEGAIIWRPLLPFSKSVILEFAHRFKIILNYSCIYKLYMLDMEFRILKIPHLVGQQEGNCDLD